MDRRPDLSCWEIMKCRPEQVERCPVFKMNKPCWEVMQEIDSRCANVCGDCLVLITKQQNSILSDEEIAIILAQKGVAIAAAHHICPHLHLVEEKG